MQFWKYEGLGNDLVFVRGGPDLVVPRGWTVETWVRDACDRHLGIGADGVMFVDTEPRPPDIATIHYYNADGSSSQMCGNGLRCAALFLYESGMAPSAEVFSVEMVGSGRHRCIVRATSIEVEIGSPERGKGAEGEPRRIRLGWGGRDIEIIPVSIGNPHAVILGDLPWAEMRELGPAIENHRLFPDRVNVEFARVDGPDLIELVVWERGCGFTQACGSGACAAVAAAVWEGQCDATGPVAVHMPGGTVRVRLDAGVAWLEGPARLVFSGTFDQRDLPL